MWMVFGIGAVAAAVLNLLQKTRERETKWLRFVSLSLTILTLCAFYSQDAKWVVHEDWAALMDVTPTMSKALWVCSGLSILLNGITLFEKKQ